MTNLKVIPKGIKGFRKGNKYRFKKGYHPKTEFKKGYKVSEITKKEMSKSKRGKNHPNWKGGGNRTKMWRKKNMDKVLYWNGRRRANKLNAEGSHTFGEWELLKKQYGYCCPSCGKCESEIELSEDHIIPLSKGGSDYIENIQPLCRSCNSKKHTKIIKY